MASEQRRLTPEQIEAQYQGSKRLAPGFWEDAAGHLHVSIPELLALFGWPDDVAHRALVQGEVERWLRQEHPDVTIVHQEPQP